MKFKITMKDPDGFANSIREAADGETENKDEAEQRAEELKQYTKKWFKYEEYLTVEIDTESGAAAGTIKVCEI